DYYCTSYETDDTFIF
nr:immunoglobulin light chain junction region [Macaca mulatta]